MTVNYSFEGKLVIPLGTIKQPYNFYSLGTAEVVFPASKPSLPFPQLHREAGMLSQSEQA